MKQLVAVALREAIAPYVKQQATPATCHAIKKDFIRIMRDRFSVNWRRQSKQMRVTFRPDGKPDIQIPEELLEHALH